MEIIFLERKDIDTDKWDKTIQNATNGLPYAYSWYLDICTDGNWEALLSPDYQFILPLPSNRKILGYKQIYHPYFSQQLGLFSNQKITPEILRLFLSAIPSNIRKFHLDFNFGNPVVSIPNFEIYKKDNFILPLDNDYEAIRKNYSKLQKRNINKAVKNRITKQAISVDALINFYIIHKANQTFDFDNKLKEKLQSLCEALVKKEIGFPTGILDQEGNLYAACFWIKSHRRFIYFVAVSSEIGRELRAMPFLIDQLIQEEANSQQVVDFEGSAVESIASFFKRFGAEKQAYFNLSFNNLPSVVKLIKK